MLQPRLRESSSYKLPVSSKARLLLSQMDKLKPSSSSKPSKDKDKDKVHLNNKVKFKARVVMEIRFGSLLHAQ